MRAASALRDPACVGRRALANDNDLSLMQRIDELFTAWPFLGLRRMTTMLRAEGHAVKL
jgi:putative transposase